MTDTGKLLEQVRYLPYGPSYALPTGDTDTNGTWGSSDESKIMPVSSIPPYDVRCDADLDGAVDTTDVSHANSITSSGQTLGRDILISAGVENYIGYGGYQRDVNFGVM